MRFGQLAAGIGVGLVIATGATAGWSSWQHWQTEEAIGTLNEQPTGQSTEAAKPLSYGQSAVPSPISAEQPFTNLQSNQPVPSVTISQAENDYLYDLSQALQASEQRRLTDAERLAIGHEIAGWLQAGSGYWAVRSQFDQAYKTAIAGDYGHNRDVYIKFATERLMPAFVATLTPPPPPPRVIIKTRTEYVETPGKTEVVTVTQPVPVPVPRPFPVPVPGDDSHGHGHGHGHGSDQDGSQDHDSDHHGPSDPGSHHHDSDNDWGHNSSGTDPVQPPHQQGQVPSSPEPPKPELPKPQLPELPKPEQQANQPDQPKSGDTLAPQPDLASVN